MYNYNTPQTGNYNLLKSYSLFKTYNELVEGDDATEDKVESKEADNEENK